MIATATSPLGEMASPSGPSPTTTRSVMRAGLSSRSTTLTVSTLPSDDPAPPMSAVSAILPLGATATLYGHWPVGKSSLLYVTLSPLTSSSDTLWALNLAAMARLPSGVKATCVTLSPIATVSSTFTSVPLTESTLIVPSARLVTSARLPAALMLKPDGCLPTVTVAASFGGLALRSMT